MGSVEFCIPVLFDGIWIESLVEHPSHISEPFAITDASQSPTEIEAKTDKIRFYRKNGDTRS